MISDVGELIIDETLHVCSLFQDQLSADMYSFVAKEIDYANYFQNVSVVKYRKCCVIRGASYDRVSMFHLFSSFIADRNAGRISQEVIRNSSQHPAPN